MKLQLVSMECSSDMSQMDLLTDTVQKMIDANVSEEERNSLISDLLKYLGGLDNELIFPGGAPEPKAVDTIPSVSIVEALTNSGSFSEEFSLPTLLRAVKATDNKQMASQATLTAIEVFFKNTHKGMGEGGVTNDHIRAMSSLLQLLTTGVLLAVARISGETAPLLFTALNNQFFTADMNQPMANLPVVIYRFAMSPYEDWQSIAWGAALLVTFSVLLLNILSRTLFRQKNPQ